MQAAGYQIPAAVAAPMFITPTTGAVAGYQVPPMNGANHAPAESMPSAIYGG